MIKSSRKMRMSITDTRKECPGLSDEFTKASRPPTDLVTYMTTLSTYVGRIQLDPSVMYAFINKFPSQRQEQEE